jgi:hypothetical protein
MKAFFIAIIITAFTAGMLTAGQPNPHVTLTAKPSKAYTAGSGTDLKIYFRPHKGIHINLDPAIDITVGKNSVAATVGKISASKDAHGYLDAARPVVVSLTPSPDAPKGKRTLTLRVVYFLCSDAEGWCNRDEQSLDIPLTVK